MNGRVRVKICGITRHEDAHCAALAGADAIGLVFWPGSRRAISADRAAPIVAALPPFVTTVGLFVDADPALVRAVRDTVGLDCLQFHGNESPEYCQSFDRPWLKAIRVGDCIDVRGAMLRYAAAQAILLDRYDAAQPGGTGVVFDWSLVPAQRDTVMILAGGLHSGNVAAAIRRLRPWAVDVSSGVESAPGIKDGTKIRNFIDAVRAVDRIETET